ncbi:hypothetical protein MMPV_001200 [Pyropia vietnamensis]
MPVSAQAAFAVCAGLLFLVGVLDAVGVIPLVLRMLSVGPGEEADERVSRRERTGSRGALLRSSRSAGSTDSVLDRGVSTSQSYALGRGSSRMKAAQLQRSWSKGSRWKGMLSEDGPIGGSLHDLKPRRTKLREVVQAPNVDRPLAYTGSESYSSDASNEISGYTYSDSLTSSDGRHMYSTDGEQFGDGSSVTAYEKDDPLGSDYTTDSELGGSNGGGDSGGRGGGGGHRRSGSSLSTTKRVHSYPDNGDGRWMSGSDVEVGNGRAAKGSFRRATFSTPAVEEILTPPSMLPTLTRAEKAVMVVTWERLIGAFLCVCSLLSLLGSYMAMNGLPELLSPARRLTGGAAAGAPTVLQEEQS